MTDQQAIETTTHDSSILGTDKTKEDLQIYRQCRWNEMQAVSHVEGLKRFSPSNTDLCQTITAAEAEELKNFANLYIVQVDAARSYTVCQFSYLRAIVLSYDALYRFPLFFSHHVITVQSTNVTQRRGTSSL